MKGCLVVVAFAVLAASGLASAQTPAPAPAPELECDTEVRQLRYLTRFFGQTRTEAEFEVARQRARADRAETEVARLKALLSTLPAGKSEGK